MILLILQSKVIVITLFICLSYLSVFCVSAISVHVFSFGEGRGGGGAEVYSGPIRMAPEYLSLLTLIT